MFHSTYLEISRAAYANNIAQLRLLLGGSKLCAVVKGNAYGHGIEQIVPLALENKVRDFAVFSADEAWRVKKLLPGNEDVMIMGMIPDDAMEWAIREGVSYYVFNLQRLEKSLNTARRLGMKARIHLEVETGMNRTGLDRKSFKTALDYLREHPDLLQFSGLCTHFAGAESISNYYRIQKQIRRYKDYVSYTRKMDLHPADLHAACSAAIIRYPGTRLDLVRTGILQYGFFPSPEIFIDYTKRSGNFDNPFRRIIRWVSQIMDIKAVVKGDFIGYGSGYQSNADMRIASVPVGYAHGFSRSLSNQGSVLIRGMRHQVIGIVNMNMLLCDISKLDHPQVGEEAVIIGRQDEAEISVASFCEMSNQVDYELLTRLNANIPRVIVD
jgi:alanine racemase